MPDLSLDLRYLKYAILVAEHGSFRRAAEILGLSQSTVSRRVQLLERRLGAPLFDRDKSGARLTPVGARLADAPRSACNNGTFHGFHPSC
ncbi:LysR family transcriptional regulator [Phyllobacterium sp. K27]